MLHESHYDLKQSPSSTSSSNFWKTAKFHTSSDFALTYVRKDITHFCKMFDRSLRSSHFRSQWKKFIIVAITKPYKLKSIIENYCPMSLLSSLNKILNKLLLDLIILFNRKYHLPLTVGVPQKIFISIFLVVKRSMLKLFFRHYCHHQALSAG